MPNNDYTQIVLLCEDRQQEVFLCTFLIQFFGVPRGRIRRVVAPAGSGSGEQYVRKQYPIEVKVYRSKRNHLNIRLVVIIDADTYLMKDRYKQLENELSAKNSDTRQPDEHIAIFIPKRNIETWIYWLQGTAVDEVAKYPHFEKQGDCKPHVKTLAEDCAKKVLLPANAPESLKAACEELERILLP